jgi:hypothetical protein
MFENPDAAAEKRKMAWAKTMQRELRITGASAKFGPGDYVEIEPSVEADGLARWLTSRALGPLREAITAGQVPDLEVADIAEVGGTKLDVAQITPKAENVPEEVSEAGFYFGLPLLLSIAEPLVEPALHLVVHRSMEKYPLDRTKRIELGMRLVTLEAFLWELALTHGADTAVIPFASRVRSLRWWWEPVQGRQPNASLCIRCGRIEITKATRSGPPYCRHCLNNKTLMRANTIAPHERGTWWIKCTTPGCSTAFVGSAQARHCPDHRQERITPGRRRP